MEEDQSLRERPEQRCQGEAVHLPVVDQLPHFVERDPLERVHLVRVGPAYLLRAVCDVDAETLVADPR